MKLNRILKRTMHLIHPLLQTDLLFIKKLQPEGWSDITPYIEFYLRTNYCFPVKIIVHNELAGIGTCIVHHHTAWLAHIIVHPDHRNKGLGTILTQALIDLLKQKNCSTIQLIATSLGKPVYSKLGFTSETDYLLFTCDQPLTATTITTPFDKKFEREIIALDHHVTGENRQELLSEHLPFSRLIIENNTLEGFYLPTLGEGLIIAKKEEAGAALLALKHSSINKTGLPIDNKVGIEFFTRHGLTESFRGTKMILGDKLKWHPENMYSRIGGNLG